MKTENEKYALHFLNDFAPEFATNQYTLAKKYLFRSALGLAAVREFPEGGEGRPDVDSGPVLFGLGPSASGFAIAAAAAMGDKEFAWQLIKASALAGIPVYNGHELYYQSMPPVGQAVVLYGKTLLSKPYSERSGN